MFWIKLQKNFICCCTFVRFFPLLLILRHISTAIASRFNAGFICDMFLFELPIIPMLITLLLAITPPTLNRASIVKTLNGRPAPVQSQPNQPGQRSSNPPSNFGYNKITPPMVLVFWLTAYGKNIFRSILSLLKVLVCTYLHTLQYMHTLGYFMC